MADTSYLPRWQSHKIVHAAKIESITGRMIQLILPSNSALARAVVEAAPKMFDRYTPVPGDYYVVFDDGFATVTPRQQFEEGYHRL